jgi:hypothetical protein
MMDLITDKHWQYMLYDEFIPMSLEKAKGKTHYTKNI